MILSDRPTIDAYRKEGVWGDQTLADIFRKTAARHPGRIALCDPPDRVEFTNGGQRCLTYNELARAVGLMAGRLRGLGLRQDDVVAFQLPNTVEQVVVLLAAFETGMIVSPMPLPWRQHEMAAALDLVAPRELIAMDRIAGYRPAAAAMDVAARQLSGRFVMGFGHDLPVEVERLDSVFEATGLPATGYTGCGSADSVATVTWTCGGSTPVPIPRSHNQWIAAGLMVGLEAAVDDGATILAPYPLTGLVPTATFLVPWLLSGGTLVLHHPFAPDTFVEQMDRHRVSFTGLPPTVIEELADLDELAIGRRGCMACIWPGPTLPTHIPLMSGSSGGWPIIDIRAFGEVAFLAQRRHGATPAAIPLGDVTFPTGRRGGVRLLQTRVKGRIMNNATERHLLGGELLVRSPMQPDSVYPTAADGQLTAPLRDPRGFAPTGLRCRLDGGDQPAIEVLRSTNGVIWHGGLAISADELDRLYRRLGKVEDAAAFASTDPVLGDRIMAAVVPRPGATVTRDDLAAYLKARKVAPYKVPEGVITVDAIPRDADGRVL